MFGLCATLHHFSFYNLLFKTRAKTLVHDLKDCVLAVDTDNFDDDLAGSTDGRKNSLFLTQSQTPSMSSEPIRTSKLISNSKGIHFAPSTFKETISNFPPPQQFTRSKTNFGSFESSNDFNNVKDKFKQLDVRNITLARIYF